MPNDPGPQLPVPPELAWEEVRELGYRAISETTEAKMKAYDLLAKSHELLKRIDELLARR